MRACSLTFASRRFFLILSASLIGVLIGTAPAFAQSTGRDPSAKAEVMEKSIQSGAKGPQNEAASGGSKISTADSTLMRELAKANLAEIQMSGLALAISRNEAVRGLSEKLLNDHTNAMNELRKIATAKGVILPGGVEKEQAAALRQLALLTSDEFDRQYLGQAGISLHEQSIALLENAHGRAKDSDLKAFVSRHLPVMNQHLQMGQKLRESRQPPAEAPVKQ